MSFKSRFCVRPRHLPAAAGLSILLMLHAGFPAWALPTEYSVEQGSVSSETDGSTEHFHIGTDQAILNFPQFNIAPSETVEFHFHTAAPALSSILNRVTGEELSTIAGALLSNGRVFLINPAGIHITDTARIETAGFVASTLNISNEDFLSKNYRFLREDGQPASSVINEGRILARPGDLVVLLGGAVQNTGYLVAEVGTVALAAGDQITLSFDREGWLAVAVTDPLTEVAQGADGRPVLSAVDQSGTISAPGGHVLIQARAAEGLFNRLVNLPAGIVEAVSVLLHNGRIELVGEGGKVVVGGTLSANADEGGKAGDVRVTGDDVVLEPNSRLEAKAPVQNGEGGSVQVTSTHPKESGSVDFQPGAVIDVNGGSASGNAGSIELSAAQVGFNGQAAGAAAPGSTGGKLLVDPLFVIFNNTVRPAPPSNPDGTPDVAAGDAPAAGTTFVYIASILGFSEAYFQAVNDITVNRDITMDAGNSLRLESGRDTFLNANVQTQGAGKISMIADADFSGAGGAASDGIGSIVLAAGKSIQSDSGEVNLSAGGDLTMTDTSSLTTGSGKVTLHSGGKMDLRKITSTSGDIELTAGGDLTAFKDVLTGGAGKIGAQAGGILVGKETLEAVDGKVTLDSGARLDVVRAASGTGDVELTAGEDIIVRNAVVTGGAGSVSLEADDSVEIQGFYQAFVRALGTGTVSVDAGLDGTGQLIMETDTEILSGSGDIDVTSSGPMDLWRVASTSGNIHADSGDALVIRDSMTTGGAGSITAEADDSLTVEAGTTLVRASGSGGVTLTGGADGTGPLTTNAGSTLQTGSGPLALNSAGDMSLSKILSASGDITAISGGGFALNKSMVTGGAGKISVQANGGPLSLNAGGKMDTAGGSVGLTAAGLMTISDAIATVGGDVTLNGASGIDLNAANADVTTGGAKFTANADSDGNHIGDFKQVDGLSVVNTAGGEVSVSGDKVDLDGSIRSGAGKMTVTSTGGLMSVSKTLETVGGEMTLNSANGINLDGPTSITTGGAKFTANADSDGNHIGDFNQIDAASVVNSGAGDLSVSGHRVDADGTLRTNTGKLEVTSTGGYAALGGTVMTTLGDIIVHAAQDLLLNSALSTVSTDGGAVTLQADADANHTGDYIQNVLGSHVSSGGGALTVSGQQIFLTDAFLESEGGSMQLNGADGIEAAGAASLLTQGGSFTAQADADGNDAGDFNQTGLASVINSGAGVLSITAKRVNTDGFVRSTTGDITLTSPTSFIMVSNKISTEGGKVSLHAANGITLDHADADVSTLGGEFSADANTDSNNTGTFLQSDAGSVVNTAGGKLSVTARDMDLQGDLRSGAGQMALTSTKGSLAASHLLETTGAPVDLLAANGILLSGATVRTNGGAFSADANSDADTDGDFSHLGAAGLINTAGGELSISGRTVNMEGALRSGAGEMGVTATFGGITASGDLLSTGGRIDLQAANGILLNGNAVRTEGGALAADANTNGDVNGDFVQAGAGSVINTGAGEIGLSGCRLDTDGTIDNTAADIHLTATGGFARLSGAVTTQGGNVTINAEDDLILDDSAADILTHGGSFTANANTDGNDDGEFNQSSGSLIDTAGGALTITADDFNMSGDLRSGAGTTSLLNSRAGSEIYLGNAVRVNGQINLSDGEADRIVADTLVIGGNTAGGVVIGDFSPVSVNTLVLRTGAGVAEEGPADALADLVVPNLGVRSVSGVNLDVDVTHLAIRNDGIGAINVEDMAGGMAVGTVAGISGVSTLGGGITLVTHSPFSVNNPISDLGGGNITLAALGTSAADDLSLHANVTAAGGNGSILLVAGDTLTLDPGVTVSAAGTGSITAASGEDFTDGLLNQNGNNLLGDVLMGLGSAIRTEDGNILVDAAHDLGLSVLNANSDGDKLIGNVTTFSRFGKTFDTSGGALNITAKNLRMFSYQDIGSKKDPINISRDAKINKPAKSSFLVYPSLPLLDSDRYIKVHK